MNDWPDIERFIGPDGRLTLEGLAWIRALVAYINALEARIAALE